MVVSQLRFQAGRAAALAAALLIAVTSFAVLTGTARTQRLDVAATVARNDRGAYDLLVRPAGARSALETRGGLVSSTALTNLTGGITTAQWQRILGVPDVAAAAPIAVVGYSLPLLSVPVNVTGYVDKNASAQVLHVASTQVSERGLTRVPGDDVYAYVTANPLHANLDHSEPPLQTAPTEVVSPDTGNIICAQPPSNLVHVDPATGRLTPPQVNIFCGSTNADDTHNAPDAVNPAATGTPATQAQPTGAVQISWQFPYLIEAVDPVQEEKLAGLAGAVTSGSYFAPGAGPVDQHGDPGTHWGAGSPADSYVHWTRIPALMASSSPVDEQLQITVSRLPDEAGRQVRAGDDTAKLAAQWRGMPATQLGAVTIDAQHAYRTMLDDLEHESAGAAETLLTASTFTELPAFMSAGPIAYAPRADGLAAVALPPQTLPHDDGIDSTSATDLADTAVRSVARHAVGSRSQHTQNGVPAGLDVIGEFDPAKLSATSAGLGAVPMETYFPAQAAGADAASRTALGDQSLLPNENIRGLLSVPPSVITTLSSLSALDDPNRYGSDPGTLRPDSAAPISVVRVRLTGQLGIDPVSRERVRLAAQRIHDATGLDVDVTMGSSPAPVTVTDPAGNFGRPALTLAEMWSKKGVAAVVVAAVDRKSFVLTTLVLLVCALFVAGATAAAVRTRRTQLAVLACLGWPRSRLFTLVLAEVLAIAAAAGIVGAIVAEPVGRLLGIRVSAGSALLAVPAAMGLAAAAAAWPAARAGGAHPGEAVSPAVAVPRRPSRLVGITGLALGNLRRVPGRAVLGASSLAIGVAALVGLAAISTAFHGAVTGSLLGDAVSVQVRGTDYAAAAIAAGLGAATIADVLYVNIRDRAGEYALLHAVGWHDRALGRLVLTEAAAMGAAGALVGVTAATAADTAFAGRFVLSTLVTAGGVALAAVALTLVCAAVPARALRRMPAARLLAEE